MTLADAQTSTPSGRVATVHTPSRPSVGRPARSFNRCRVDWSTLHPRDRLRLRMQNLAKLDGDYQIGECFLTVSLGEPFGGAVHKLIAAVVTAERR